MQPFARGNPADANMPTAQNLLSDQCYQDGVIDVVICGVTGCDILECQPSHKTNDTWIARLKRSVGSVVHGPKLADEGFDDDLRWVKHDQTSQTDLLSSHAPVTAIRRPDALLFSRLATSLSPSLAPYRRRP